MRASILALIGLCLGLAACCAPAIHAQDAHAGVPADTGVLLNPAISSPGLEAKNCLIAISDASGLRVHGRGRFEIEHRIKGAVIARTETREDPIYSVNGVDIGYWPSHIVTYRLEDGTELTCRATGRQGDTESIEVWVPAYSTQRPYGVILGVNGDDPRLVKAEVAEALSAGPSRDRGVILAWDSKACAWREIAPAIVDPGSPRD